MHTSTDGRTDDRPTDWQRRQQHGTAWHGMAWHGWVQQHSSTVARQHGVSWMTGPHANASRCCLSVHSLTVAVEG